MSVWPSHGGSPAQRTMHVPSSHASHAGSHPVGGGNATLHASPVVLELLLEECVVPPSLDPLVVVFDGSDVPDDVAGVETLVASMLVPALVASWVESPSTSSSSPSSNAGFTIRHPHRANADPQTTMRCMNTSNTS